MNILQVFIALVVLEVCLELLSFLDARARNRSLRPHYPWMFCTTSGRRLTSDRGLLKLSLHPSALYKNQPNQRAESFNTNSHGLRGPEAATGSRGVLVLGGSTAFGTGLDSDEETIPAALGCLSGRESVNAGVIES